ncbi:MAG TPA: trans-2-enoyl-CoA reductase family protein [Gammaproteobacteria bacterium]|nr:trans-2-enoyl-CoA reductase family protein [Gammaproteobacteria bacterium]
MLIIPKVRGFVCTTAHPVGCEAHVQEQISYVKRQERIANGPKKVLVIGASTGYGLASRITAAFGSNADTLGIFFEKEPEPNRTASAGWYNAVAFEKAAKAEGLYAKSVNGDAFSDAIKEKVIQILKDEVGPVDLVIYSVASPRRTHPKTQYTAKSVLKPIGQTVTEKTLDTDKAEVKTITIEPATPEEIADTVQVMGGEDWEMWLQALEEANLLAKGCKTISYTYIGAKQTWPIYGKAAIGKAKEDLDRAAKALHHYLSAKEGTAYVAVMKAIVTQASSAIPIMPLYISLLYKVMKENGLHEGAIEQIYRLFATQLFNNKPVDAMKRDEAGRIRMDDWELREDIQEKVEDLWAKVDTQNLYEMTDFKGYQADFLKLFGFGFSSVNYEADVNPEVF